MKRLIAINAALGAYMLLVPVAVGAQGLGGLQATLTQVLQAVNTAVPIAAGLALLFFFWGLALFILNAGNEDKRKEGRSAMLWGILALFVIASIWGIIGFIGSLFGISTVGGGTINLPRVN